MRVVQTEGVRFHGDVSPAGEGELQRLHDFQAALVGVHHIETIDGSLPLAGDDPVHDTAQYFLRTHARASNALFVNPEHQTLTEATPVSFEPRSARGGQHSAHGVMFGDLLLDNGEVVPVAVKPHQDDPQMSAVKEYFCDVAVRQLGLENLVPFGVVITRHGASYSLTHLEEGLTTLDSIDWRYVVDHVEDNSDLLATWSNVARYAALLHSVGNVRQGDFAPRNIAQRPDNAGIFLIDWEKSRISTDTPRDAEVRWNNSYFDMGELLEALIRPVESETPNGELKTGIGLLQGTMEQQWQGWEHLVFNEYRAMRLEYARNKHELREVEDELRELQNSLRQRLRLVNHYLGRDE